MTARMKTNNTKRTNYTDWLVITMQFRDLIK